MKKRDQAQARYPQHKQDFFHERKEKVYFIAFSRFLLPVDIQDILFTSFIFIREICRHNTVTEILHCVMLSRSKQCNALVPMIGTEITYRYATQIW